LNGTGGGGQRPATVRFDDGACVKPRMSRNSFWRSRPRLRTDRFSRSPTPLLPLSASFRVGDGEAEVVNSGDLGHSLVVVSRRCGP
jgi:hypothetical protein